MHAPALVPADLDAPLILTVAPNGAYKKATDHPAVPVTPGQLAETAKRCLDAGAAMLHMHVRKADQSHSLEPDAYMAATRAVRQAVGNELVIQITTEAAGVYAPDEQVAAVMAVRPEAVSVGLREIALGPQADARVASLFSWLARERVMTQVILYDAGDIERWMDYRRQGVVPDAPWFVLFVLGRYSAGQMSSPSDLLPFLAAYDQAHPWAMCAFGRHEHACAAAAAALGGHVRVGFENNLYLRDGSLAPDNAALVRQVAEVAAALGRPLATAGQIRARFHGDE
ncbi:class III aminotransferase [Pigmentiphaga sp. NML080357]|uniref:3-keto-5-aminohexanoate cleavage protein n=1 Tax=Pigmentiphaga sp. NML080357 TaxID=2008675 RepID=UPI000B4234E4|nr:3-keto-5-aminohexanoate cleavage protein [Pigmentiphaga sp. NML080357]OVZ60840.1 class III aminotransferase [Pigmentiphaga sp. NML080357]